MDIYKHHSKSNNSIFFILSQGFWKDFLWRSYDEWTFVLITKNFHLSVADIDDETIYKKTTPVMEVCQKQRYFIKYLQAEFESIDIQQYLVNIYRVEAVDVSMIRR